MMTYERNLGVAASHSSQLADGTRRRNLDLRMFLHAGMNSQKI